MLTDLEKLQLRKNVQLIMKKNPGTSADQLYKTFTQVFGGHSEEEFTEIKKLVVYEHFKNVD